MVYLDIVNTYVGRLYHERQDTIVGCTVESDTQWTFPISLHYQYSLLTPEYASRFTRVVSQPSNIDFTQNVKEPPKTPETPKSHSLPRLTFAPQNASDTSKSSTADQQEMVPTQSDTKNRRDILIDEHFVMSVHGDDNILSHDEVNDSQHEDHTDTVSNDITGSDSEGEDAILVVPRASIAVPMVSVIMTTYNCVKYIEHAIRSLQCQTLTNWELVVVDDRSTDGTDQLLRILAEEDDRIVYLHNQHNVGCYASKNIGIRYARGTWLTFQDADDHSLSQRFEKQLTFCMTGESESGSNMTLHKGDVTVHDACYVVSLARKQKVWTWIPITLFLPLQLFREKLGAFDTVRFGADSEMRRRLQTLRLRVGVLDDYLYACPDRWIELSSRTTSLTGDITKDPIRELYRKGYMDMHTPLLRTSTLSEADARFLRYPFPPFKRQDTHERTHPFPIDGLSKEDGDSLFPSTQEIHANLSLYAELQ